jgi:hypothetical protein
MGCGTLRINAYQGQRNSQLDVGTNLKLIRRDNIPQIVSHGLDLAHIVSGQCLPVTNVVLMAVVGPLYPIWLSLVGRRLLQLASPLLNGLRQQSNQFANSESPATRTVF